MTHHDEAESVTGWIGYSDFLLTLVILFFIGSAAAPVGPAGLKGTVVSGPHRPVANCLVTLGPWPVTYTTERGHFSIELPGLSDEAEHPLSVRCPGYGGIRRTIRVTPGKTQTVDVSVSPEYDPVSEDSSVWHWQIEGDALFGKDSAVLRPEGVLEIQEIGRKMRNVLRPNEWIAVQGHTDDQAYPKDAEMDNWVLSGARAAAAARVLTTDSASAWHIPPCRVIIMGFGSSHPAEKLGTRDDPSERRKKRQANRRIEFRRLHGSDLASEECVDRGAG